MATARARPGTAPRRGEGREALLEAVVAIVARDGFDALTYRAVAAEAGVTHGLVTYYFGSRETMIAEALKYAAEHAIAGTSILVGAEGVDDFATELADFVEADADGQAFQHQLKLEARRRPDIEPEVLAMRAHYLDVVRGSLERLGLGDDIALARLVLAALDGLVLQQLISGRPEHTREAVERLQEILRILRERGAA